MESPSKIVVVPGSERCVFIRGEQVKVSFSVMNFNPFNLENCSFEAAIDSLWQDSRTIDSISATSNINFEFDSAPLKRGVYELNYKLSQQQHLLAEGTLKFAVAAKNNPAQMQLWHWPATVHYNMLEAGREHARKEIDRLAELGYTWSQMRDHWVVRHPEEARRLIEYARTKGIEMGLLIDNANGGALKFSDELPEAAALIRADGSSNGLANAFHPAVADRNRLLLERLMCIVRDLPYCSTVFMNSEIEDKLCLAVDGESVKMHEKALGFSLDKVKELAPVFADPEPEADYIQDGVISDDDYEYLYTKYYFKQGDGFVFTNTLMGDTVRKYRPDIKTISDPLRLCSILNRFDGVDIVSSWTYTNPDPKLTLFIESLFTEAAPENKDVIHTITLWNYAGSLIPSNGNRFAREQTLRMGPDRWLENAWINFSRGPRGIGTYFGSPLELALEDGDDFIYSHATLDAIKKFSHEIMRPFGELTRRTRNVPRKVAVLDSFASRVYSVAPRPYCHYQTYYIYNFYTVMNMAHIPADVVFEETVLNEGLDQYDMLALPSCDTLPESVYRKVLEFAERGGIVIADQYLRADIPDVIRFDFDFTYRRRVNANANTRGMDFVEKDDCASRREWHQSKVSGVTAEEDQQIMESYAAQLRQKLEDCIERQVDCSSPALLLNTRESNGVTYIFIVNDRRTYGDRVGEYKSMLEKGLSESAEFTVNNAGRDVAVYDVTTGEEVKYQQDNAGNITFELEIPAAWGKIIAVYPQKLEKIEISMPDFIARGTTAGILISRHSSNGLQPLEVRITDPTGNLNEYSSFCVMENGEIMLEFIPACNEPAGAWTVGVKDLTTGNETTHQFKVS